ncbi:MAG: hypothetical protein JW725_04975, partial [Candidatus Babeliaceae bacterium]|nr:hypothetical protein [Candidatus Babeliaceae bacterium]
MMKCFFVTALSNIEIPGDLGRGDKITDTAFITNNSPAIERYLTPGFEKSAGSLETNFIRRAPAVIYGLEDRPDTTIPDEFVLEKLSLINSYLNSLWLFKDNAVDNQLVFGICTKTGESVIHSNEHMVRLSTSDGGCLATTFSREELKEARKLFNDHIRIGRFVPTGSSAAVAPLSRLQRALYFTSGARSQNDIGLKVTHYCSAIEALFAMGNTELTHQLSERVASFLEDDPQRRVELYTDVKRAYGLRSIVVHGAGTKAANLDKFIEAARTLDMILRQVYLKIFTDEIALALIHLDDAQFNSHFLLRIFGASWKDVSAGENVPPLSGARCHPEAGGVVDET